MYILTSISYHIQIILLVWNLRQGSPMAVTKPWALCSADDDVDDFCDFAMSDDDDDVDDDLALQK